MWIVNSFYSFILSFIKSYNHLCTWKWNNCCVSKSFLIRILKDCVQFRLQEPGNIIISQVIYLMTSQLSPGLRSAEHGTGSAGVECQPYPVPLVIHTPGGVEPGPGLYNVIITVTCMRVSLLTWWGWTNWLFVISLLFLLSWLTVVIS